jgi:TolB-like protein
MRNGIVKILIMSSIMIASVFAAGPVSADNAFDKALEQIAAEIKSGRSLKPNSKFVIIGFQESSMAQTRFVLSSVIEEELSIALVRRMPNRVIAKNHIETVIRELGITRDDIFDASNRKRFGKLLSADYILTGSYYVFDNYVNIDIILLDIESGLGLFADRIRLKKSSFSDENFYVERTQRQSRNY